MSPRGDTLPPLCSVLIEDIQLLIQSLSDVIAYSSESDLIQTPSLRYITITNPFKKKKENQIPLQEVRNDCKVIN